MHKYSSKKIEIIEIVFAVAKWFYTDDTGQKVNATLEMTYSHTKSKLLPISLLLSVVIIW